MLADSFASGTGNGALEPNSTSLLSDLRLALVARLLSTVNSSLANHRESEPSSSAEDGSASGIRENGAKAANGDPGEGKKSPLEFKNLSSLRSAQETNASAQMLMLRLPAAIQTNHYDGQQNSVINLVDQITALVTPIGTKLINETKLHREHDQLAATILQQAEQQQQQLLLQPEESFFDVNIILTIVYLAIFIIGVIGNICNCLVIADSRNKYMKTATNFYLFSLSVSDLLLLIFGIPHDIVNLWHPTPYLFGSFVCISRGWISEASTYASVLVIVAFTVERYLAICHPLKAHTLSRLSRSIKIIILIWLVASSCALVVVNQYGIVSIKEERNKYSIQCTMVERNASVFELSVLIFFIIPMAIITLLYLKLGYHLRQKAQIMKRNQEKRKERRFIQQQQQQQQQRQRKFLNRSFYLNSKSSGRLANKAPDGQKNESKGSKTMLEMRSSSVCCQPTQDCSISNCESSINLDSSNKSYCIEEGAFSCSEPRGCFSGVLFFKSKQPLKGTLNLESTSLDKDDDDDDEIVTFSQTTLRTEKEKEKLSLPQHSASCRLKLSSGELYSSFGAAEDINSKTTPNLAARRASNSSNQLNLSTLSDNDRRVELKTQSSCQLAAEVAEDRLNKIDDSRPVLCLSERREKARRSELSASCNKIENAPIKGAQADGLQASVSKPGSSQQVTSPPNPLSNEGGEAYTSKSCSPLPSAAASSQTAHQQQHHHPRQKSSFIARKLCFIHPNQSLVRIPNGRSEQQNAQVATTSIASCGIKRNNNLSLKQPIALQSTANTANVQNVIKMLVSVVVMFFICWAPFHAQRLMAVYVTEPTSEQEFIYSLLNHISGISYYISAVVNPILYRIWFVNETEFAKLSTNRTSKLTQQEFHSVHLSSSEAEKLERILEVEFGGNYERFDECADYIDKLKSKLIERNAKKLSSCCSLDLLNVTNCKPAAGAGAGAPKNVLKKDEIPLMSLPPPSAEELELDREDKEGNISASLSKEEEKEAISEEEVSSLKKLKRKRKKKGLAKKIQEDNENENSESSQ